MPSFKFPFKDKAGKDVRDASVYYDALALASSGYFPLGPSGVHCGIHYEQAMANMLSLDEGIYCTTHGRSPQGTSPENIPAYEGVNIDWAHRNEQGVADLDAARRGAQAMVNGYHMAHSAALTSRHTQKRAIDMTISGMINRSIMNASGNTTVIQSTAQLHTVGASYGVIKLVSDPPHWSDDGH